ncbi:hypothetical protein OEA41_006155 [Lepraria neglecta]|uniref:Uncharacterized protein n=1 Tax=Lepraria neglecta TaxID=209136 RepID=A0AAD9Z7G3_9LECA|nr:hypothetical protein OEA41_006155 [Lepraria neglecta]
MLIEEVRIEDGSIEDGGIDENSEVEKGMATEMLKEIAMRKNLRFPKLKDILLEEENDLDDKIEKACEKVGIVIKQLRRMT